MVGPTPGTEVRSSSFARHNGEARTAVSISRVEVSESSFSKASRGVRCSFLRRLSGRVAQPLFFGDDHLDDLAAPGDEIGEELGSASASGRMAGLAASTKRAITAASIGSVLRSLAERLGEGPDLRRIDDDDGEARRRQSRSDNGFEPARRLDRDARPGASGRKRSTRSAKALAVARDHKGRPVRPHMNVEPVLRHIDSDTRAISILPRPCATGLLRPKRLFEVDGTTERLPRLRSGLERPRMSRRPLRHRTTQPIR